MRRAPCVARAPPHPKHAPLPPSPSPRADDAIRSDAVYPDAYDSPAAFARSIRAVKLLATQEALDLGEVAEAKVPASLLRGLGGKVGKVVAGVKRRRENDGACWECGGTDHKARSCYERGGREEHEQMCEMEDDGSDGD